MKNMFVCLFIELSTCMSEDQPATDEGKLSTCCICRMHTKFLLVKL